jgi:hypothetical protein
MPICPVCDSPMSADQVVSMAGIQSKEVSWRCERDDVHAGAVHPVQISHLKVGSEDEHAGRRTRIIKLEMQGAELLVFRQLLGGRDPSTQDHA